VSAQNAVKRTAHVSALAGKVVYSSGGGPFGPVAIGTKLEEGDEIKTAAGSHVDIDMGGNVGLVQVAPNSTFKITTNRTTDTPADKITETEVNLKSGAMYFKVNKLAKGSRYEITTPKGIAGIRGTSGYLTADGQLTIGDGMAGIAYPNNGGVDTFIVHAGETVGPNDRPPHPAPGQILRDIVEALRDAATHGIGHDLQPFVPPLEPFISPTLPGR
jgi:hypothetical protein